MTFSSQEWCGQVFSQLNKRSDGFTLESYSYFEKEGDQRLTMPVTITEDELWTRIRFNPQELPQGEITILPAMMASRLQHFPMTGQQGTASFTTEMSTAAYRVEFEDSRTLTIFFESEFPYEIKGWEETSGGMTTRARRKKLLKLPYWQLNKNKDQIWRDSLDLN
jgi:hypothetical protein